MAYNPFNIFRRNQKAIFAVLTVFIMIMFTLSSGVVGGDFFDWLPRWIGSKSRKGDVLATIDGEKIYDSELNQLRVERTMANQFMSLANDFAIGVTREGMPLGGGLEQYIEDRRKDVSAENYELLTVRGPQAIQQLEDPQFQAIFRSSPQFAQQFQRTADAYRALINSSTLRQAERELINALRYRGTLAAIRNAAQGPPGQRDERFFFVNAPNRTRRDLLDFMLWQKKADQLGVRFTTDDVKALIQREFFGAFTSDVPVRQIMQREMQGFNMDSCLKAIAEEFRVRTAQTACLGPGLAVLDDPFRPGQRDVMVGLTGLRRPDKTFGGAPLFHTPFEVFEFYRENVSPTRYEVVAVPAANFTADLGREPTEEELRELYRKHKDEEPNPAKETPGFKEPRKLKVGWVSATGTEPYYVKLAEAQLKAATDYQTQGTAMLTAPLPGIGPGWAGMLALPQAVPDLVLKDAYDAFVRDHQAQLASKWSRSFLFGLDVLDTSVVRPPTLAAAAGGFGGSAAGFGGPFEGIVATASAAWAYETRDRLRAGLPGLLAVMPGPGILGTKVAAEAAFRDALPKPLSLAAVKPTLLKRLTDRTAQQLARKDLETFKAEVAKLAAAVKGKDYQSVRDYAAKFAADRGWQVGASGDPRDEWTLEEDPALAPVKAAFDKTMLRTPHGGATPRFGARLFWADAQSPDPRQRADGVFKPEYYPGQPQNPDLLSPEAAAEPIFLVWRTEDVPAKASVDYTKDRPKVVAAWKRIQAREKARAAADALAAEIRKLPGDSQLVIQQNIKDLVDNTLRNRWKDDPKARDAVRLFTLAGVAPLAPLDPRQALAMGMGATGGLVPFWLSVDPTNPATDYPRPTADVPYPTKEMRAALLDHRTDPAKTTFVLADRAKDTYYVVTLLGREAKSDIDFKLNVFNDFGFDRQQREMVLSEHRREAAREMLESVMGLIKKEFRFEVTDEQRKRLDEGDRRGGGEG